MAEKEDDRERMGFPEGYEHLEGMTRAAANRARELDERIKNIPVEEPRQFHQRLQYHPAALQKASRTYANRESREMLEEMKAENENELMQQVTPYLIHAEPEELADIKLTIQEQLHPNPFKGMTSAQLDKAKGMTKDFQHSQDFMRARLDQFRAGQRNSPEPDRPETGKSKTEPDKQKETMSMSARFTQTLTYSRIREKTPDTPVRTPLPQKTKSEKERE